MQHKFNITLTLDTDPGAQPKIQIEDTTGSEPQDLRNTAQEFTCLANDSSYTVEGNAQEVSIHVNRQLRIGESEPVLLRIDQDGQELREIVFRDMHDLVIFGNTMKRLVESRIILEEVGVWI